MCTKGQPDRQRWRPTLEKMSKVPSARMNMSIVGLHKIPPQWNLQKWTLMGLQGSGCCFPASRLVNPTQSFPNHTHQGSAPLFCQQLFEGLTLPAPPFPSVPELSIHLHTRPNPSPSQTDGPIPSNSTWVVFMARCLELINYSSLKRILPSWDLLMKPIWVERLLGDPYRGCAYLPALVGECVRVYWLAQLYVCTLHIKTGPLQGANPRGLSTTSWSHHVGRGCSCVRWRGRSGSHGYYAHVSKTF